MITPETVLLSSAPFFCGLIARGTCAKFPSIPPRTRGGQYLPASQTFIPHLSPADTPIAVFLHRKCGTAERSGAAWLGPAHVCSCIQAAQGQRAGRVGAYLTGPWRLVLVPRRRAERSGAPGARATKRLQDGGEDEKSFKYSLAHLFVMAG